MSVLVSSSHSDWQSTAEGDAIAAAAAGLLAPGSKRGGRTLDLVLAAVGLVVASPVLAVAALAIKFTSRGPAFFRQRRVGLDGRSFTLLKLRTMHVGGDDGAYRALVVREMTEPDAAPGTADGVFKLDDDDRIFPIGRVLRRFSLDEIPQLLNVVRGDMAVVGPRPLEPFECALHSAYHAQRQLVRPGLTGLWQVSGRNLLNARQMLDLDVQYVARRSWVLDASIVVRTPRAMISGDGAR